MGTTRLGVCGCGDRGFDIRGCFLLNFQVARLGAAVDLSSGFEARPSAWLAVTIGFSGTSVTI